MITLIARPQGERWPPYRDCHPEAFWGEASASPQNKDCRSELMGTRVPAALIYEVSSTVVQSTGSRKQTAKV